MVKSVKDSVGSSTYDKIKEAVDRNDDEFENPVVVEKVSRKAEKVRPARKKTYERVVATQLPKHVIESFAQDGYELRWIRFLINGQEDYKNLHNREQEGYEFVTADELPNDYLSAVRIYDGKSRQGLVTSGDVCLVKVDADLRKSRNAYFKQQTDYEVQAADIFNLSKKGFKDLGSKSSSSIGKEPSFQ